jgi:glutathione S-transferase
MSFIFFFFFHNLDNRQRLWNKLGRFQVPWLLDRNTGVSLFESEAIVEYLDKQYGIEPSPVAFI